MSERASGSIVIVAGSSPVFQRNVFIGLSPEAFVTLDETNRTALKNLNWFLPAVEPVKPRPSANRASQRIQGRGELPLPRERVPEGRVRADMQNSVPLALTRRFAPPSPRGRGILRVEQHCQTMDSEQTMKTVFQQLGPYEIIQSIGHGMAGSVFLARDRRTDQRVALKIVPHGTDHDAIEIIAAERWGAELQKQLSQVSSRVPAVFEHGDHESGYYVSMEYLDGENLSSVISRGPIPAEQAAEIGIELCRFLEDAHRFEAVIGNRELRSLVHGDLTPRNVRITSNQKVKVLDFGIAKALSLSRKVTRNDFGTLCYLSPERLESGVVDEHADYWSVGIMLYEMVRAARPFQAEDTRRLERLILSRTGAPPLNESCPHGLESIIAKLLAPNANERYASAQAIREDLERFRSSEVTHAEQEGWPRPADGPADEAATRRTPPVDHDNEKTRRTSKPQSTNSAVIDRRYRRGRLLLGTTVQVPDATPSPSCSSCSSALWETRSG